MAVAANDRRDVYTATADQTDFPFTFVVFAPADLRVERLRGTTVTVLDLTTDYTVTGGVGATGTVVLQAGALAGDRITITSAQANARASGYSDSGTLPAASLNADLDRLWISMQQIAQTVGRQITAPVSDAAGLGYELPLASLRAGKLLGFDVDGRPVVAEGASIGGVTVSSFGQSVIASADAAAVRLLLELGGAALLGVGADDAGKLLTRAQLDARFATAAQGLLAASALQPGDVADVVVQRAYAETTAHASLTALIPRDDTVPGIGEGTQVLTLTLTPTSATNRLRATFSAVGYTGAVPWNFAIFAGSTCVLAADATSAPSASAPGLGHGQVEWVAGGTSEVAISVRVGAGGSSTTLYLNGTSGGRLYGGANRGATLVVEELAVAP